MCTGAVLHLDENGRDPSLCIWGSPCADQVYQIPCSPGNVLPPTTSEYNVGESVAFQAFKTWIGDKARCLMLFSVWICPVVNHSPPQIPIGNILSFAPELERLLALCHTLFWSRRMENCYLPFLWFCCALGYVKGKIRWSMCDSTQLSLVTLGAYEAWSMKVPMPDLMLQENDIS